MNERSGSDQVADVEHVAARAAAAESILAFGDDGMSLWHGPLHRMGSAVSAPFDR